MNVDERDLTSQRPSLLDLIKIKQGCSAYPDFLSEIAELTSRQEYRADHLILSREDFKDLSDESELWKIIKFASLGDWGYVNFIAGYPHTLTTRPVRKCEMRSHARGFCVGEGVNLLKLREEMASIWSDTPDIALWESYWNMKKEVPFAIGDFESSISFRFQNSPDGPIIQVFPSHRCDDRKILAEARAVEVEIDLLEREFTKRQSELKSATRDRMLEGINRPLSDLESSFSFIKRDDAHSLRELLENGLNPNSQYPESGDLYLYTLLMASIENNSKKCFDMLLPISDVNLMNGDGSSALSIAISSTRRDMVESLAPLSLLEATDIYGDTPLIKAVKNEDLFMVQIILDAGALPNGAFTGLQGVREPTPWITPVHHSIKTGLDAISQLLISKGADPFIRDDLGHDVFHESQTPHFRERLEGIKALAEKARFERETQTGSQAPTRRI